MLPVPTKQLTHMTTEDRVREAAEEWRADLAAKGLRVYAAAFGVGICKIGETPWNEKKKWLSGRITGGLEE